MTFDASALLRDALALYGRLMSYQDEGRVSVESPLLDSGDRVSFETLFVRPSSFRFKFVSPHPHPPLAHLAVTAVCGLDREGAYLWMRPYDDPAQMAVHGDISMAVAAATGISHMSAHNIGQLLMPSIGGARFAELGGVTGGDAAVVEGLRCRTVRGTIPGTDAEVILFIDPETLVIPRIDTRFSEFRSAEVRRSIRINQPIDPEKFTRPNGEI